MEHKPIVPLDQSFDALYGLQLLENEGETARAQVEVRDCIKQPMGLVHGGVYASIAESLASLATYKVIGSENKIAVGLSNHTSFLRPITDGYIHASAVAKHRGRRTWVWEVDITNDAGKLCAAVRVTLAVQEIPTGS